MHGLTRLPEKAECVQVAGLSKCVKVTLNGSKVYSGWRGSSKNTDIGYCFKLYSKACARDTLSV